MAGESVNPYLKYIDTRKLYRIPSVLFIFFGAVYLLWLVNHLNPEAYALGVVFFITQLFVYISFAISIINHWDSRYRIVRPEISNNPPVAIVVPTYNEPVYVVEKTIRSILKIRYSGEVVILLSNDSQDRQQRSKLTKMMGKLSDYWEQKACASADGFRRELYLLHTERHNGAKAGNLNQALKFLRKHFPKTDLLLTQDADEHIKPDILNATVGYFQNPNIAYVQTIKQAKVLNEDPFGNGDRLWYARTAAARDARNAMFACGSGVVWRISALEHIGGFSTWNLVEDLTTSYNLLSARWEGVYHYEALSEGLAPEDLPNYIKQRGTWALDTARLFFWDNPLFKKGLTLAQKLQFLELALFYFNGIFIMLLIAITSISLFWGYWPTNVDAATHARYLIPGFISMEIYYFSLAGKIPIKRTRQLQISLSPVFAMAAMKALVYGPNKKPRYKVTLKKNTYGNYLPLVAPQIGIVVALTLGVAKSVTGTPLYSKFDWAIVFWGIYQALFYFQIIRLSWWKWRPQFSFNLPQLPVFRTQTNVGVSYSPETL